MTDKKDCSHWRRDLTKIINDGLDYLAVCKDCGLEFVTNRLSGVSRRAKIEKLRKAREEKPE